MCDTEKIRQKLKQGVFCYLDDIKSWSMYTL
jgi:hypothetical protein